MTAKKATLTGNRGLLDLKSDVFDIGPDKLRQVIGDCSEQFGQMPTLILKEPYSVTFQDPVRDGVFKRHQCHAGDEFYLKDIRSTKANAIILIFEAGPNVKKNMSLQGKGPGLKYAWNTVEFTMKAFNNERMNASKFLIDVLHIHKTWQDDNHSSELYQDSTAGSW